MPTVVITGASQGIGRAVALAFAGVPDTRLALVSRRPDVLETVARACREKGTQAAGFACDVTDETAVARMAAQVTEAWGTPDVLVNNAGVFEPGLLVDTTAASFRHQVETNLTSAFLVTQAFLPAFLTREQGHIFFMASVASIRAYAGGVAYCAAKHGLLGLARVVREETRLHGIRVTTLLPGATRTPSWDGTSEPDDRFMPPEDIAQALLGAYELSSRSVVEELVLRPQEGDL